LHPPLGVDLDVSLATNIEHKSPDGNASSTFHFIPLFPTLDQLQSTFSPKIPTLTGSRNLSARRSRTIRWGARQECQLKKPPFRDLVMNRRARFDYELLDHFETGISLLGSEVKSIRSGQANLAEAFVHVRKGQAWLNQCHISPYLEASVFNHEPVRPRRLLLQKHEILKIQRGTLQKGMTVVPVRLYLKGHLIKLEVALARGKNVRDKRHTIKEREAKRRMRNDDR
jgi:SsrA-binding protein